MGCTHMHTILYKVVHITVCRQELDFTICYDFCFVYALGSLRVDGIYKVRCLSAEQTFSIHLRYHFIKMQIILMGMITVVILVTVIRSKTVISCRAVNVKILDCISLANICYKTF